ncbi:MAG: glyceraldehyde 3-phosphate dehydrogenase NAD-binding domain-containing protein, partial [Pseudomonadota bacterium]|nr:glyceraldehyde 3-phosphate dehydrogenase NAD-binding domain-containing protein [Pseudomonadota bacterium]
MLAGVFQNHHRVLERKRSIRIGINGLGRIGRLAIRVIQNHPTLKLVHVNDVAGDA